MLLLSMEGQSVERFYQDQLRIGRRMNIKLVLSKVDVFCMINVTNVVSIIHGDASLLIKMFI